MVVGWIFDGVGCHATSKCYELSCEIDYDISFWSWILLWKYPHLVEISKFRGYYPHLVYISVFRGDYPHFVEITTFPGYHPYLVYISVFRGDYPHFVEISTFRGYHPHFIRSISHILLI